MGRYMGASLTNCTVNCRLIVYSEYDCLDVLWAAKLKWGIRLVGQTKLLVLYGNHSSTLSWDQRVFCFPPKSIHCGYILLLRKSPRSSVSQSWPSWPELKLSTGNWPKALPRAGTAHYHCWYLTKAPMGAKPDPRGRNVSDDMWCWMQKKITVGPESKVYIPVLKKKQNTRKPHPSLLRWFFSTFLPPNRKAHL